MNVLIVGKSGQIGGELLASASTEWNVRATTRSEIDMTCPQSIAPVMRQFQPDVVVNATGYTAVDRAESEPDLAHRINAEAVGELARQARSVGAALVHYSTDYVYDGRKLTAYLPSDATDPQSVYGRSKLLGERLVAESGVSHVILRTQWVYGLTGRNFVLAILRQSTTKPELRVVSDQVGAPTWSRAIARATVQIVDQCDPQRGFANRGGTYHLACGGSTTWFDFAKAVFENLALRNPARTQPAIVPVSTAEFGARAVRPAHAILDCAATEKAFGVRMPHWRDALHEAMQDQTLLAAALA